MNHALAMALCLVCLACAAGCGGGSLAQQGPSDTLRAYARALEEGRADDAYRLLSDEARRSMPLEAFRRAVKDNPQDALEIARSLSRPATDPMVTATVTMPSGEELLLVFEGGKWRIDAAAVDLYGQSTPRQAIVGFLRAYDRKRWDVILRYVPEAEIEGLGEVTAGPAVPEGGGEKAPPASGMGATPQAPAAPASDDGRLTPAKLRAAWEGNQKDEIRQIVEAIKAALPSAKIEETGETASMPYGAGGTVALVREHGVWKIKDL